MSGELGNMSDIIEVYNNSTHVYEMHFLRDVLDFLGILLMFNKL